MSVAKATEAVASSRISHNSVPLHWAPPGLQSNLDILDPDEVPISPHLEPVARISVYQFDRSFVIMLSPSIFCIDGSTAGHVALVTCCMPSLKKFLCIIWQLSSALMLHAEGQDHLFENWPAAGTEDAEKHKFFAQVDSFNAYISMPWNPECSFRISNCHTMSPSLVKNSKNIY